MINTEELERKKCVECGHELAAPGSFPEGSYCHKYCCMCCPDSKISPCWKERTYGTFLQQVEGEK